MHTSLDSALGRQRRLNSVGESVLQIAPNAAAAYSLRSLTGGDPKVVRVRRDTGGGAGDNDEEDFTVSGISSGALVNFVGAGNDGFVETWYDQSGNGRDAEQETASKQPKIVNSGSLFGNGLHFDGSGDLLNLPHPLISNINSVSLLVVATNEATGFQFSQLIGVSLSNVVPFQMPFYFIANLFTAYSINSIDLGAADTNKHLFTTVAGSSNTESFLDSTSKGTLDSVSGYDEPSSGGLGGASVGTWNGKIEEIIIYASDQSDNRVALEANIMTNYGIS
tara:strand:+ start:215 stop:1051 length:837 start_codon:yes stop_codon:yes gene_type:complete